MLAPDYKRLTVISAVVAMATLTWWAAHAWLTGPSPFTDITTMPLPALALCALTAVAGLAFSLLHSWLDRIAVMLASWATFIIFWAPDIWYVTALPIFLFFWYEASRRALDDLSDRRKVRINATLGRSVKLILLGVFLMVSLGFFLLPQNRTSDLGTVSRGVQGALESAYDAPLVEQQLSQLPPALQSQFRRDLAKTVDESVQGYLGPLKGFVPPFLAFALFLALWSMSFVFREVAIWIGVGLFALLRAIGFVKVEEVDARAEVLSL